MKLVHGDNKFSNTEEFIIEYNSSNNEVQLYNRKQDCYLECENNILNWLVKPDKSRFVSLIFKCIWRGNKYTVRFESQNDHGFAVWYYTDKLSLEITRQTEILSR